MDEKIEILRKNILVAGVFSIVYEILKEETITKRIEKFLGNTYDYRNEVLLLDEKERPLQASLEWLKKMNAINNRDLESFNDIKNCRNFLVHEIFRFISEDASKWDINKKFNKMVNLLKKIDRWWIMETGVGDDLNQNEIKPGSVLLVKMILDMAFGSEDVLKEYYDYLPMEEIMKEIDWEPLRLFED